jgi:hypothetical protein
MEDYSYIQGGDFAHVPVEPAGSNLMDGFAAALEAFKSGQSKKALKNDDADSKWLSDEDRQKLMGRRRESEDRAWAKEAHDTDIAYKKSATAKNLYGGKASGSSSSDKLKSERVKHLYKNLDDSYSTIMGMESRKELEIMGKDLATVKNSPQYQSQKRRARGYVKELQSLGLPVNEEYLKFLEGEDAPVQKGGAPTVDPLDDLVKNRGKGGTANLSGKNGVKKGGKAPNMIPQKMLGTKTPTQKWVDYTKEGASHILGGAWDSLVENFSRVGESIMGIDERVQAEEVTQSTEVASQKEADSLRNMLNEVVTNPRSEEAKAIFEALRQPEHFKKLSPYGQLLLMETIKENTDTYPEAKEWGPVPSVNDGRTQLQKLQGGAAGTIMGGF